MEHTVGSELHTGHESENRVAEHEHQHSRRGAEGRQNSDRRAVEEYSRRDYDPDADNNETAHLEDTLHRVDALILAFFEGGEKRMYYLADEVDAGPYDIYVGSLLGELISRGMGGEKIRQQPVDNESRTKLGEAAQDFVGEEIVVPARR